MKIVEKLSEKNENIRSARQPVIAFLGDSVTQGCFECYMNGETLETVFDTKSSYVEKFKTILATLFPKANPTIVNAGISGNKAFEGLNRIDNDVLSFKPDLVVVCYGLNDAMGCKENLEQYKNSLSEIFKKVKDSGSELIFMTPNLRADCEDPLIEDEWIKKVNRKVSENENQGWLQTYLACAKEICERENIPVCDCNNIWQRFKDGGVNVNSLLANRINHPLRELHWIFAYELIKTIFS